MGRKIRVGVIFGGKSGEHEVSVQSARSIIRSLDPQKYAVVPIGIDKAGGWQAGAAARAYLDTGVVAALPDPAGKVLADAADSPVAVVPADAVRDVDVYIPALHGSYGEDGTIQGMLEMLNVPYVGAGVLASAVGMDKTFMKRLFAAAGLPQVQFVFFSRRAFETNSTGIIAEIEDKLGYPCFVKPANLGSSVGISKAKDRAGLSRAIAEAGRYDAKIIVEEGLDVRELEVAVLGNDAPQASVAGEVIPSNEFYDYRAKYVDGESALLIPAPIAEETMTELRRLAIQAYQAVDCSGLARVDFFIEKATNRLLVNEINTMPGFTQYSMYPKLWEATGVTYAELVDTLIELALARHAEKQCTITNFQLDLGPSS